MVVANFPRYYPMVAPVLPAMSVPAVVLPQAPLKVDPRPVADGSSAAMQLKAMGQSAAAGLAAPPFKTNPFIGFRANMARLRAAGVVSVPRTLSQRVTLEGASVCS